MTPEAAFSHPFIAKAVNELKCLRQGGEQKPGTASGRETEGKAPSQSSGVPPSNNSNNIKNNAGGYSNGSTHSNQQPAPNSARSNQSDNQSLPRIK